MKTLEQIVEDAEATGYGVSPRKVQKLKRAYHDLRKAMRNMGPAHPRRPLKNKLFDGRIVFPLPKSDSDDDGINLDDAIWTLLDLGEAEITISDYWKNGCTRFPSLALALDSDEKCYFHKPLRDALLDCQEMVEKPSGDDYEFEDASDREDNERVKKTHRLIDLLLGAYRQWDSENKEGNEK